MCVLYNKASVWFFAGTLIWYHTYTHTHIHTKTHRDTQHTQRPLDWHTHIIINLHHLLCVPSSYLYHIEWIIYCRVQLIFLKCRNSMSNHKKKKFNPVSWNWLIFCTSVAWHVCMKLAKLFDLIQNDFTDMSYWI